MQLWFELAEHTGMTVLTLTMSPPPEDKKNPSDELINKTLEKKLEKLAGRTATVLHTEPACTYRLETNRNKFLQDSWTEKKKGRRKI